MKARDSQGASTSTATFRRLLRAIGPAIIVASVVLGPGSILASSRVGADHGYALGWVLAGSCLLMMGMVALGAKLGLGLSKTPCAELAERLGRPVAIGIGVTVFLIVVCFQVGNNMAVLSVLPASAAESGGTLWRLFGLLALNGLAISALFGFREVYAKVERLMMFLVLLMITGFAANLLLARPDLWATLSGLVPHVSDIGALKVIPYRDAERVVDPLGAVPALIATTLSVAGAFYYAYLVREKGWSVHQLKEGMLDTLAGVGAVGAVSFAIFLTSASVFHGQDPTVELRTAGDVARQLEPLFDRWAGFLFGLGLFAGAFSSFLVNALIGGTVLADALGRSPAMNGRSVRVLTATVLAASMVMAIALEATGTNIVGLILFAQALTVLGLPALALSMIYLATRREARDSRLVPGWLLGVAVACATVSLLLAIRKAWELWLRLS